MCTERGFMAPLLKCSFLWSNVQKMLQQKNSLQVIVNPAGVFWGVKCVKANDFSNSHGDDILNIKVLQRGHIRVFTSVCLQNQLLNDPVQQQPVVQHGTALFICTGTHTCVSYSIGGQVQAGRGQVKMCLQGIKRQCCRVDSR